MSDAPSFPSSPPTWWSASKGRRRSGPSFLFLRLLPLGHPVRRDLGARPAQKAPDFGGEDEHLTGRGLWKAPNTLLLSSSGGHPFKGDSQRGP